MAYFVIKWCPITYPLTQRQSKRHFYERLSGTQPDSSHNLKAIPNYVIPLHYPISRRQPANIWDSSTYRAVNTHERVENWLLAQVMPLNCNSFRFVLRCLAIYLTPPSCSAAPPDSALRKTGLNN